jgi:hypothetical protein
LIFGVCGFEAFDIEFVSRVGNEVIGVEISVIGVEVSARRTVPN